MAVSHKDRLVFIHIPKTGGTSISLALNLRPSPQRRHLGYKNLKNKHKKDISKYFSFAFVRNPWDRVVSEFFWRKSCTHLNTKKLNLEQFIHKIKDMENPHLVNQHSFIIDNQGNKLVDFIGRFEFLKRDFDIACNKANLPEKKLPCKNKTKHKDYFEYYNSSTRKIVAEKYAEDIEYFGYEFDG
jgi:chondroitin 4-sulfotransferase 11